MLRKPHLVGGGIEGIGDRLEARVWTDVRGINQTAGDAPVTVQVANGEVDMRVVVGRPESG